MKYLIDYVRGYLTKNEGNIEPVWNMADSDFESDFEESLLFLLFQIDYLLCSATLILCATLDSRLGPFYFEINVVSDIERL